MIRHLVVLLLLAPAAGVFGLQLSGGLGLSLGASSSTASASSVTGNVTTSATTMATQTPLGVFAFVDASYAQLSVGYLVADGGSTNYYDSVGGVNTVAATLGLNLNTTYLSFSAFAKYPFKVGRLTLFPLLGAEYDLNLVYTDASGTSLISSLASPSDANQLWIKAGGGIDIPFSGFYLRPEALLGYKLLNQTERNTITSAKAAGAAGASVVDLELEFALAAGFAF